MFSPHLFVNVCKSTVIPETVSEGQKTWELSQGRTSGCFQAGEPSGNIPWLPYTQYKSTNLTWW